MMPDVELKQPSPMESSVDVEKPNEHLTFEQQTSFLRSWLVQVLNAPTTDHTPALRSLENPPVLSGRDNIEARLATLSSHSQALLQRSLIYQLPVPWDAIAALSDDLPEPVLHTSAKQAEESGLLVVGEVFGQTFYWARREIGLVLPLNSEDGPRWMRRGAATLQVIWRKDGRVPADTELHELLRLGLGAKQRELVSTALFELGQRWIDQHRYVEVRDLCMRAQNAVGEDWTSLFWLARSQEVLGDRDAAHQARRRALELRGHIRDCLTSSLLCEQGQALLSRGFLDQALERFKEAIEIDAERGDIHRLAVSRGHIADVFHARGELDEALRIRLEIEVPVYHHVEDLHSLAVTYGKIADIHQERGDFDTALRIRFEQELPVYKQLGDVHSSAIALGRIADVYQVRGEIDRSLHIRSTEQLPVFQRLGDVYEVAVTQGKIADLHQARHELEESLRIRKDLEIPTYERLGDLRSLAAAKNNLAMVFLQRNQPGDRELARTHLQEALVLAESMRIPEAHSLRVMLARLGSTAT